MSVIYLTNPEHGTKVAISEAEAVNDEQSGWKRYNPLTEATKAESAIGNELEVKRRGRQPKAAE